MLRISWLRVSAWTHNLSESKTFDIRQILKKRKESVIILYLRCSTLDKLNMSVSKGSPKRMEHTHSSRREKKVRSKGTER